MAHAAHESHRIVAGIGIEDADLFHIRQDAQAGRAGPERRETFDPLAPEAAAKGLDLRLHLAAPDGPVATFALMRALANPVSKAIRSTRQGRVIIALRRNGPALDADGFARAIGRSHRPPRNLDHAEGNGLGLAIVTGIVAENHRWLANCTHRRTGASMGLEIPPGGANCPSGMPGGQIFRRGGGAWTHLLSPEKGCIFECV